LSLQQAQSVGEEFVGGLPRYYEPEGDAAKYVEDAAAMAPQTSVEVAVVAVVFVKVVFVEVVFVALGSTSAHTPVANGTANQKDSKRILGGIRDSWETQLTKRGVCHREVNCRRVCGLLPKAFNHVKRPKPL
jgi:hypothetical protein